MMKKKNWDLKYELHCMAGELAGSFLAAIGTYNFAVSLNVPLTGVTGIAVILHRLYGLPIGWISLLLNVPLALLCIRVLGKKFFLRSIRCMIFGSLIVDYIAPLLPVYTGDRMLAALCTGALAGLGYGIIYKQNSSTGGSDFITVAVKSRFPHIPMGSIEFVAAFAVLGLYALIFGEADSIIYGLVISFISAEVINRMLIGTNQGAITLTITNRPKLVCDLINELIGRGSTVVDGYGGYTGDRKSVVMCVSSPSQMYVLQRALEKEDPGSFTVQLFCSEIHGEGFRVLTLGHEERPIEISGRIPPEQEGIRKMQ